MPQIIRTSVESLNLRPPPYGQCPNGCGVNLRGGFPKGTLWQIFIYEKKSLSRYYRYVCITNNIRKQCQKYFSLSEMETKLIHLTYCLSGCKSIVPVALFPLGFLSSSIRNNNRRILNVKMSSEVGNIVRSGKDCQKKSKSEIPHFFLSSNFMIFTNIYLLPLRDASKYCA